jgi:hypothetical protein
MKTVTPATSTSTSATAIAAARPNALPVPQSDHHHPAALPPAATDSRVSPVVMSTFCAKLSMYVNEDREWTGDENLPAPSGVLMFRNDPSKVGHCEAFRLIKLKGDGQCASRALHIALNPETICLVKRDCGIPVNQSDREDEQRRMDAQMLK